MSDNVRPAVSVAKNFWILDILVLVFFLSTAAAGIYLFRQDLMRTIDSRNEEAAGIIIIRNNIVQRRHFDRVLWDRLFTNSPVYSGDLIRAAELSDATVYIDDNQINVNENTLIRIQYSQDGRGSFEVELREGNLNVITGGKSGLMLNLMGRKVEIESGTALDAEFNEEGIVVKVGEGSATFVEEGQSRQITEGMIIAQDTKGAERVIPAAVVTSIVSNARYLKTMQEPLPVGFGWQSMNIDDDEAVRLEIAGDRNFVKDFRAIEGFDGQALVAFDPGRWYWRLAYKNSILSRGQLTVAEASGPQLLSPAMDSIFRYQNAPPKIRFQWEEKDGASHYVFEVDETKEFNNPRINRELKAASFITSELEAGTWYWRVRPIFSSAYEGSAGYSETASFKIEQSFDKQAPMIEISEKALAVIPAPVNNRPAAGSRYTIKNGDTLGRIARQVYGDALLWSIIVEANGIETPDLVYPDQVIYLP